MGDPDVAALLAVYDAQLRAHVSDRLPAGMRLERDGPLLRFVGSRPHGFVVYRDLAGLDGAELDDLIARQVQIFAERNEGFEWKLHSHDRPADLAERLRAAGFVPGDVETVVVARVAAVAVGTTFPAEVTLREVHERADLDRIAGMQEAISKHDSGWLADSLEEERAADPEGLVIVVAEAGDIVVSAGWVRFPRETEFATLWGGATLPAWRRRGIYRALVRYRAHLAAQRRVRYLQVDASDESRPILERLGFVAVTTTTPFVWSPSRRSAAGQ